VLAVNYTASAVASSEHAVMHGNRTWTLYTAQADYAAATDICSSQGLQLVSVHSAADNAALAALAAKHPKWSAGFAVNGTLLLGLRYNASSQAYAWQDGSRGDWSPFGTEGMPAPPAGKDCVAILADGWWQPVSCTRLPGSFACQSGDYGLLARDYPQFKLGVSNSTASWAELWRPDGELSSNDTSSAGVNGSIMSNTTDEIPGLEQCFFSICAATAQYNISGFNETHARLDAVTNVSSTDATTPLYDFLMGHPACLRDADGLPLARYLLAVGYSSGMCQNATYQSNITEWLRSVVHGADASHATGTCSAGLYVPSYVYATANFSMSVAQYSPEPAVFLKVAASVDPIWQMQQQHQGRKMIFWKQALLSIEPALFAPPVSYGLPSSYYLSVSTDGTCATNGVRLPIYGGTAMFYPRIVPAADGGAHLEVWGHADTAEMDPAQAAGRLGPGGWMRAAVRFITQVPSGVF
jgi:hypothetical protein